ncbi:MAG: AAA domain-containing protein [Pirellulaceae bacterium]
MVIDEACQCTEPTVWQSHAAGRSIDLAGDHCQLPPRSSLPKQPAKAFHAA